MSATAEPAAMVLLSIRGNATTSLTEAVRRALLRWYCGKAQVGAGKEEGTSHSRGENQWHLVLQTIQNQLCTPSWGKPTVR